MIHIEFWNYQGEKNVVDKTAYLYDEDDQSLAIRSATGEFRADTSVLTPEIIFEDNANVASETEYDVLRFGKEANYAYIPEFGRYYFVTEKTAVASEDERNLWRVKLRVDVLMTYKDDITGLDAMVERYESAPAGYDFVPDNMRAYYADPTIQIIQPAQTSVFEGTSGIQNGKYIVVCVAGNKGAI